MPFPITYPFPPLSACEGIVKSIAVLKSCTAVIEKLEVLSPLEYTAYDYINTGLQRYRNSISSGNADLKYATVLLEPRFRISGYVARDERYPAINNSLHAYQYQLLRGIYRGAVRSVASMGLVKFPAYIRPPSHDPPQDITFNIPKMLIRIFDTFKGGKMLTNQGKPKPFFDSVKIEKGVVDYGKFSTIAGS
jgi:hypothetical protein